MDEISLSGAPPIPGLRFRRFRGESDFAPMADVYNRASAADGVDMAATADTIAHSLAHAVRCDPLADRLLVEVDHTLIGWGRVTWERVADGAWIYHHAGWIVPEWQRRGIGCALLRWQEDRLRQIAADHIDSGARCFESWASEAETQSARKSLLMAAGYTPHRFEADMVRDLEDIPAAPLPDGIEVRPVQPGHLRAIFEAEHDAAGEEGEHKSTRDSAFEAFVNDRLNDYDLWRVAWDGDQVVGMVRSYIDPEENEAFNRKRGWTEHISVREAWRRRGIARALLCQSLQAVKERGMAEAALGVNTRNPHEAFRLYESVGFRRVALFGFYRKPLDSTGIELTRGRITMRPAQKQEE